MKGGGGGGGAVAPAKRRWRGLVIAVLGLVLLSMLVPLIFLLGLHNGFHSSSSSGYGNEHQRPASSGVKNNVEIVITNPKVIPRNEDSQVINLEPTHPKDVPKTAVQESETDNIGQSQNPDHRTIVNEAENRSTVKSEHPDVPRTSVNEAYNKTTGFPTPTAIPKPRQERNGTVRPVVSANEQIQRIDEHEKLCELKYGSFCKWLRAHREPMKDYIVKKMKDQLYVARAYYPTVAKLPAYEKLSHELRQNIQDFERIFSESSTDSDLPPQIESKIKRMEAAISKAKSVPSDCNNIDKKLRQLVDLTEDEANFHLKQSAFMHQLAVQTTPKSLHCLLMRLTVEYFRSSLDMEQSLGDVYSNPELHHYVILSNNVLASSVVVNSTVTNARASANQVFHVVTNRQNFFAMKLWFFINSYKDATVQVLNIEDLGLDGDDKASHFNLSLPEEFRVSYFGFDRQSPTGFRTEYLSIFSHLHYFLPHIFPTLKKVVVLDDDIVVQRDLSALWNLDMNGKVNGAVQFCNVRLSGLKTYLGESNYDGNSCAWMSGLNVVDLVRWREQGVTKTYEKFVEEYGEQSSNEDGFSRAVTLRATLLTFQGLVYPLDERWMLSGLGHDHNLDDDSIKKAAVLHYNGNMKPWLELGIAKYKSLWGTYLKRGHPYLTECNVNVNTNAS